MIFLKIMKKLGFCVLLTAISLAASGCLASCDGGNTTAPDPDPVVKPDPDPDPDPNPGTPETPSVSYTFTIDTSPEEELHFEKRNVTIGGYNGIKEAEACEKDFELLEKCGIDVIYMTYFHSDPAFKSDQCVKWMEKHEIKCWYNDYELNEKLKEGCDAATVLEMTAPYRNSSSFAGNYLADEPSGSDLAGLKTAYDTYKAALPECEMYINLLPNYADPSAYINNSYSRYIAKFIQEFGCGYVSQDIYPLRVNGDNRTIISGYYSGLYEMAKQARDSDREYWLYIYTMYDSVNEALGMKYKPRLADMRFEAFNAMAFGVNAITYYCFATPNSYANSDSFGIVNNHSEYGMWDDAVQLTKDIKALRNVFPKYKWNGVTFGGKYNSLYAQFYNGVSQTYGAPLEKIESTAFLVIGSFEEIGGTGKACMIVNECDPNKQEKADIYIKTGTAKSAKAIVGEDRWNLSVNSDGYCVFPLESGQGAFITLEY